MYENYFVFLARNSVHAWITIAVTVLSESSAYCFNCFTKLFGKSQVVLTFIDSFIDLRWDNNTIFVKSHIYSNTERFIITVLPYIRYARL